MRQNALADVSRVRPIAKDDEVIRVVIETPKGSRNKFSFDQEERAFVLKKVLPAGMTFPYEFGFFPSTLADDGDPVDVMVLMDDPAFPGCIVNCRLIGIIQGEQGTGKKKERNDRVVAVEEGNHAWAKIRHIDDLGKAFVKELEAFFVNYHQLKGKEYRILKVKGPAAARKCVESGMKAYKKS
jgi:inorganic pyrophosphatase